MNKVMLIGRLTKDPEVKNTNNGTAVCSFTVAVDRKFKDQNGQKQTDFINCVAWRQTATVVGQYFHKGSRIGIVGNIQVRTYDDQNGKKVYVTEVIVDEVEFIDTKSDNQVQQPTPIPQTPPEVVPIPPMPDAQNVSAEDANLLPFDVLNL